VTDPPRHPRRAPQNGSQRAAPRPAPPIKALKAPIADSASPYGLGLIAEGRSVIHPNRGVNSQPAEKGHFSTGLDILHSRRDTLRQAAVEADWQAWRRSDRLHRLYSREQPSRRQEHPPTPPSPRKLLIAPGAWSPATNR